MTIEPTDSVFCDATSQLETGVNTIPWNRRRELGLALREAFTSGVASDAALDLAHQLAADPKWEVRHTVADSLAVVPQDDYDRLAARLLADSNTYVRRAAQRAQDRRRKEAAASSRKRRSADQVHEHLQAIEAEYGKAAAAKALRMCERYNELFVSSMVHDLRSIVTHHKANCHALIEGADDEPRAKTRRARLRGDLEFLERRIEDMATITQQAPRERRRERLAVVVDEALDLARNNVRKLGLDPEMVAVEVDVPGSIVVEIARPQIVMALANVLKNGFEAFIVVEGVLLEGRIEVGAERTDDHVTITVRDNGQGMSNEEARRSLLLTPGRRNKSKRQSTGYGLPIAARNLAGHGGTLAIDGRENQGTTVTMTLPIREETP